MSTYYDDNIDKIAIIGLTCRFPGANSADEFWENICAGVESITFFTDDELLAAGVSPETIKNPNYIKAKGIIEDVDLFDAEFFKINPKEAAMLDTQHRLFLESAWKAMEDAGYNPLDYNGRIGLYAGVDANTYMINNLMTNPKLLSSVSQLQSMMNDKDYMTTRVSYKLNLRGPSISVQTACSSSLVAVHLACESLLNGESDMAMAGGISISHPIKSGFFAEEGGVVSLDGHVRPFDNKASGTLYGNGVGIIVLKKLENALRDRDHIYAVIRGTAINNDGALKVGYTAPSVEGQASVVTEAMSIAGVDPEMVTYIETHGTGTQLGDTIEVTALTKAFDSVRNKKKHCAIASVKGNIGHISTAAGSASIIKVALSLENGLVLPNINFEKPNTKIDFENSPFYVNTELKEWKSTNGPRIAGVSAFGLGGTNAHVILEEAPPIEEFKEERDWKLLLFSAKNEAVLEDSLSQMASFLAKKPDINISDAAYTLMAGREHFKVRCALAARDAEDARKTLENSSSKRLLKGVYDEEPRNVAFMFSGLGDQYKGMAQGLYKNEPIFRKYFDLCADAMRQTLGIDLVAKVFNDKEESNSYNPDEEKFDLKNMLSAASNQRAEVSELGEPSIAYPSIFAVEYSLASMLIELGIKPTAFIGHSIGEYTAAAISGVFSVEDTMILLYNRGALVESLPAGAMITIQASEETVKEIMDENLSISTINAPSTCGVSGPADMMEDFEKKLAANKIAFLRVKTNYAFHSRMVEPVLDSFKKVLDGIKFKKPKIPFISNYTGTWIKENEAVDPMYWVKHLRNTVRFSAGISLLWKDSGRILVEIGPGSTLTTLAVQHPDSKGAVERAISTIRREYEKMPDQLFLLNSLGKLWLCGVNIQWDNFFGVEKRRRVGLPTYPFQRTRHWIEPGTGNHFMMDANTRKSIDEWLYIPSWKIAPKAGISLEFGQKDEPVVLLRHADGFSADFEVFLRRHFTNVISVVSGEKYEKKSENSFVVDIQKSSDYHMLIKDIMNAKDFPARVINLLMASENTCSSEKDAYTNLDMGIGSLSHFIAVLDKHKISNRPEFSIITDCAYDITGHEELKPQNAGIKAYSKIAFQEYLDIRIRNIDIDTKEPSAEDTYGMIINEIYSGRDYSETAIRGSKRWKRNYESLKTDKNSGKTNLKDDGVYLITGGLGPVGVCIAELIVSRVKANIILAGSPKGELPEDLRRRIDKVRNSAASVTIKELDLLKEEELAGLSGEIQSQFGRINGIIHAAGSENSKLFKFVRELELNEISKHLREKVSSLYLIEKVFGGKALDFFIVNSSLAHITGGIGLAGYATADAVSDTIAESRLIFSKRHVTSIDWDIWQLNEPVEGGQTEMAFSAEEAAKILFMVADLPVESRVIVSPVDLMHRVKESMKKPGAFDSVDESGNSLVHKRPDLRNDYAAPRNETDEKVIAIWQQALGIKGIGIYDNFFELGGNSLLAVHIVFNMNQNLGVEIPMAELIKNPTVAFLSDYIEMVKWMTGGNSEAGKIEGMVLEEIEI